MPLSEPRANRLVADVGGTNSRLALFDPLTNELRALRTYVNRDYGQFEDIIATWLDALTEPPPPDCCLGSGGTTLCRPRDHAQYRLVFLLPRPGHALRLFPAALYQRFRR